MDRETLLFANDAFYEAFNARDLDVMQALWAMVEPISCLHPGWPALCGRSAVMESWRGIFAGDGTPRILCRGARAELLEEIGIVLCYEVMESAVLAATNVFRRDGNQWRMVHHHAGPCQAPPEEVLQPEAEPSLQ